MRFGNSILVATVVSLGIASSALAQGPSAHPNQPLGAEDRLGGAPEGQSDMTTGRSNSAGNLGGQPYQPGTDGSGPTNSQMKPAPAPGAPSQR
ncbi:MAG TPA: hypothetical protein VGC39_08415 [Candidatus Methylacidiphilales bacterium]